MLNYLELENLLANIGTSFVGLDIETVPTTKACSPVHNKGGSKSKSPSVFKRSTFTAFIMGKAAGYQQRINTKAVKALAEVYGDTEIPTPQFKAQSLWNEMGRHGRGANVYHAETHEMYACVFCDVARCIPTVSYVSPAGEPIPAEKVIEAEKHDVRTVDIGGGITCEVELKYRIIKYSSIRRLRIDGQEYVIDHQSVSMEAAYEATIPAVAIQEQGATVPASSMTTTATARISG